MMLPPPAGQDQVVEDAALDQFAPAASQDQILLIGIEPVDRDVGRIGVDQ